MSFLLPFHIMNVNDQDMVHARGHYANPDANNNDDAGSTNTLNLYSDISRGRSF